jgi:hypothetical protein
MRLPSGTTLLSAAFVILSCLSSALAQVSLVRDGEPRAAIVIADSATETTRYAASELVWHVEKATGATLPAVACAHHDIHPLEMTRSDSPPRGQGMGPSQQASRL